jgi:hypothetical protein
MKNDNVMKIRDLKIGTTFYRVYYGTITKVGTISLSQDDMRYAWKGTGTLSFLKYADHKISLDTQFPVKLDEHFYLCEDESSAELLVKEYIKIKLDDKIRHLASIEKEIEELKQRLL